MSSRKSTMEDVSLTLKRLNLELISSNVYLPLLDVMDAEKIACCSEDGPIALAHSHSTTSWFITIRTSGGTCLKDKIEIPDVFTMEWTRGYRLVVVDRRGNAKIISSLGEHLNEFNFNSSIREVKDVRFFNTTHDSGVALMDDQHRIFLVNSVTDPFVWIINNPVNEAPSTWAVFQPSKEVTRTIVVIERDFYIGGQGEQLKSVDTSSWTLPEGQYAKIAVNNTRDSIAVYHSSKIIQIVTADLSTEISRVSVPGDHPMFSFGWLSPVALFYQPSRSSVQIVSTHPPEYSVKALIESDFNYYNECLSSIDIYDEQLKILQESTGNVGVFERFSNLINKKLYMDALMVLSNNATACFPIFNDNSTTKLYFQQNLLFILHSQKCDTDIQVPSGGVDFASMSCWQRKIVVKHVEQCAGCPDNNCILVKSLLDHFNTCVVKATCEICEKSMSYNLGQVIRNKEFGNMPLFAEFSSLTRMSPLFHNNYASLCASHGADVNQLKAFIKQQDIRAKANRRQRREETQKLSTIPIANGKAVSIYISSKSRLIVAIADGEGPIVGTTISLITKTENDDGLPHTLEHLVFMGSKKYPFKGMLDIIANRCLANGTNAHTDQDHTAYQLNTVGSEGFFKVLPVFLDHLLSPTLTDAQFTTEVHHITGDGIDAGVVYSEMQDFESEMEDMVTKKVKELLYPPGNAYRADAYGRLKNLRDTCNNVKVRAFHEKFYHLSNMLITVTGKLDHEKLIKIVECVEDEHLATVPASFPKPFNFQLKPITESKVEKVICPSDDESRGIVDMSWFAHKPTDIRTHCALEVMFDYMSNTPVSPLQRDFVLICDPLASAAHFHIDEQVTCIIHLSFSGVPTEKLELVNKKFLEKTVVELSNEQAWDMERMGFLIEQSIQNEYVKIENSAHEELSRQMIRFQMFDNLDEKVLFKRCDQVSVLRELKSEPASFWANLLKSIFTKPSVTVIGVPNESLVDKISKDEEARIDAQKKKLGEIGLKQKKDHLAASIKANTENKPSSEVLKPLIVKKLENFDRFSVSPINNLGSTPSINPHADAFFRQFPFPTYVHNVESKFIELFLLIDSNLLTVEQRTWLLLFNDLLFESPAVINGEMKTAEEVAKLYTKDLVDHSVEVGVSGYHERFVNLRLKVTAEDKFPNLAKWTKIISKSIIFDVDRVKMCAQKLISDARENKRDGSSVASTALCCLTYLHNTNSHLYDVIVLEKVHQTIVAMCDNDPDNVIDKLGEIRTALFANGVNAHILGNINLIDKKHFQAPMWNFALEVFGKSNEFKARMGESVDSACVNRQKVLQVGGSESSFVYQTCLMDVDWFTPALVPTMLLAQYLSQAEGPLWRQIRGGGLAYGADIYVKPDRKTITLSLYRCAQPVHAYEQTKKLVTEIIQDAKIDPSEFEAAKRSLVFDLMKNEGTRSAAGKLSILNIIRKCPPNFNVSLCEKVWHTSVDDMLKMGGQRIINLFDNFTRSIAVHPQKMGEIKKSFEGIETASVASLAYGHINPVSRRETTRKIRTSSISSPESKKSKKH